MRSGMIRKIDDWGRIVIPKEIRRVLHMKEGDPLEICLSGRVIKLERFSPLTCLKEQSESFLKVLEKELGVAAAICGLDTVISCRGVNLSGDASILPEVQSLIQNQQNYRHDDNSFLYLTDTEACPINSFYPIGTTEAPQGALILLRNKNEDTTPIQDKIAGTVALILSELIKN